MTDTRSIYSRKGRSRRAGNQALQEDPWSKLVEVIMLDQAARVFLP